MSEQETDLVGGEEVEIGFEDELFPDRVASRGLGWRAQDGLLGLLNVC